MLRVFLQLPWPQCPNMQQPSAKMQNADVTIRRRPSADDLLVLLAVGRSGRYTTAAEELGLNHTTISRRIAALEQSIGGRVLARVAGGWELTDLGREALSAAEAVESAVRSLTVDAGGARTWKAWCGSRRPTDSAPTSRLRPPPRYSGGTQRWPSRSSPPPGAPPSSVPVSISRWWSANRRSTAPRRSVSATTAWASTVPATISTNTACRRHRGSATISARLLHRLDAAGRRPRPGDEFRTRHAGIGDLHQRLRARRSHPGVGGPRPAAVLHGRPPR